MYARMKRNLVPWIVCLGTTLTWTATLCAQSAWQHREGDDVVEIRGYIAVGYSNGIATGYGPWRETKDEAEQDKAKMETQRLRILSIRRSVKWYDYVNVQQEIRYRRRPKSGRPPETQPQSPLESGLSRTLGLPGQPVRPAENLTGNSNTGNRSNCYGAIAYSSSTGRYGYSYNHATLAKAEADAERRCGVRDCRIVVSGSNTYLALARGRNYAWGSGRNESKNDAVREALDRCGGHTSDYHLQIAFHTNGSFVEDTGYVPRISSGGDSNFHSQANAFIRQNTQAAWDIVNRSRGSSGSGYNAGGSTGHVGYGFDENRGR